MPVSEVQTIEQIWPLLTDVVFLPQTESDYQRLVEVFDSLVDVVGENEAHPLAPLMEVVGVLIEKYEDGAQIVGKSPTGRATVQALRMNDLLIVRARELWVRDGWWPPAE